MSGVGLIVLAGHCSKLATRGAPGVASTAEALPALFKHRRFEFLSAHQALYGERGRQEAARTPRPGTAGGPAAPQAPASPSRRGGGRGTKPPRPSSGPAPQAPGPASPAAPGRRGDEDAVRGDRKGTEPAAPAPTSAGMAASGRGGTGAEPTPFRHRGTQSGAAIRWAR